MNPEIVFPFVIMFSIATIANIAIHFYNKKKQESLLLELKDIQCETFKNVKIKIYFSSLLSVSLQFTFADVVFIKNNILLFQKQRFIKQYGSVIRFSNDINSFRSEHLRQTYSINDYKIENGKLILFSSKSLAINVKIKATISLPPNKNIQTIIDQYDLNKKS